MKIDPKIAAEYGMLVLSDSDGQTYLVPKEVVGDYRWSPAHAQRVIDQVQRVSTEAAALPPELRAEWSSAKQELESVEVGGRDQETVLLLRVAIVAMYIGYRLWRANQEEQQQLRLTTSYETLNRKMEEARDNDIVAIANAQAIADANARAAAAANYRSPPHVTLQPHVRCRSCSTAVAMSDSYYSEDGELLCRECFSRG